MRRVIPLALVALSTACAVGPGYRRPALALPDGWRPASASADSLRPFFDSLRTSRDTLLPPGADTARVPFVYRSEEHTSELQSQSNLVCRLLLEKKNQDLPAPRAA